MCSGTHVDQAISLWAAIDTAQIQDGDSRFGSILGQEVVPERSKELAR